MTSIDKTIVLKIFSGEITDWDQLNISKKVKIKFYTLPQLSLDGESMSPSAIKVNTNQEILNGVSVIQNHLV